MKFMKSRSECDQAVAKVVENDGYRIQRRTFLLSAVIGALLSSFNDKDQHVRRSVINSIERISKQHAEVVVHAAIYFWEMNKKVNVVMHRLGFSIITCIM